MHPYRIMHVSIMYYMIIVKTLVEKAHSTAGYDCG